MVTPQYTGTIEVSEGLDRTQARIDGQYQRGRLLEFNERTGLARVRLWLRRQQTADITDVQVLVDPDTAKSWENFDVQLFAPTGRASDQAFILGPAQGQGILFDSLALAPDAVAVATDSIGPSTDGWLATVESHVPIDIPDPLRARPLGALSVSAILVALDSVQTTTPVVRLTGVTTGVTSDYRAAPVLAARSEVTDWQAGGKLPVVPFAPEGPPFRLERVRGGRRDDLRFTVTGLADTGGLGSGSWRGFTTSEDGGDERFEVPFKVQAPPRPLICIKGRVSAFVP